MEANNVPATKKKEAGLSDKLYTHSLTRSFASVLLRRGCSIKAVRELLGHSSIATTMVYSQVRYEDLANAVKMLEVKTSS